MPTDATALEVSESDALWLHARAAAHELVEMSADEDV